MLVFGFGMSRTQGERRKRVEWCRVIVKQRGGLDMTNASYGFTPWVLCVELYKDQRTKETNQGCRHGCVVWLLWCRTGKEENKMSREQCLDGVVFKLKMQLTICNIVLVKCGDVVGV